MNAKINVKKIFYIKTLILMTSLILIESISNIVEILIWVIAFLTISISTSVHFEFRLGLLLTI